MTNQLPFKTQFPLLNRAISEGRIVLDEGTKLFDIDNVAAYWIGTDENAPTEPSYGPVRLPYPNMWIEHGTHYNDHQKVRGADGTFGTPGVEGAGWRLAEYKKGSTEQQELHKMYSEPKYLKDMSGAPVSDAHIIVAQAFIDFPEKIEDFMFTIIWVDDDGNMLARLQFHHPSRFTGLSFTETEDIINAHVQPLLISIGLMNCRNIKVEGRNTKATTQRRHRKRIPVPGTEYKVIKLPGAPSNRVDGEVINEGATRYHTVRGHFKTYTAEKPLYGKLTGTWWWAPQVRGNRDHGEIISTYEQHPE